jgi:hypothetical protein
MCNYNNSNMIDKLEELKSRIQNIRYDDKPELDDIQRKTKLYLEKLFPSKFTYSSEIDRIGFYPSFYVSGMGSQPYIDAWHKGKAELTNLLDTRIEEAKLNVAALAKIKVDSPALSVVEKVVEKVVQVEDYRRINELTQELNAVKAKKSLWERINYFALGGILLTILGGAFFLGKYFGENRFDKEKIDLLFENKNLIQRTDSLNKIIITKDSEIKRLSELKK